MTIEYTTICCCTMPCHAMPYAFIENICRFVMMSCTHYYSLRHSNSARSIGKAILLGFVYFTAHTPRIIKWCAFAGRPVWFAHTKNSKIIRTHTRTNTDTYYIFIAPNKKQKNYYFSLGIKQCRIRSICNEFVSIIANTYLYSLRIMISVRFLHRSIIIWFAGVAVFCQQFAMPFSQCIYPSWHGQYKSWLFRA